MRSDPEAIRLAQERGQDLYGSFGVGEYHFIALNTDELCKEGRVTGEQLDWLRGDLADHRDARAVFVFMHRPIFSWFQGDFNPDDAEVLQSLFREYPVKAVFASHDHFYYRVDHGGVAYMTVGGGGRRCTPNHPPAASHITCWSMSEERASTTTSSSRGTCEWITPPATTGSSR
jgi:3',5'-cyclic AMP phosphodiesterase CpdA